MLVCCSVITHTEFGPGDELRRLEIPSMRYSGEPATSIGNGIGNLYVSTSCPGFNGAAFAEGDDGFLCCDRPYDIGRWAKEHGLNIGVEWHRDARRVKFCGRFVVGSVGTGYRSMADVRRSLDKFHLVVGSPDVSDHELLRGKCIAALALDPATPGISWTAYAHLYRAGHGKSVLTADDRRKLEVFGVHEINTSVPKLTTEDYEFVRCQGLDPVSLQSFDNEMEKWCYGLGPLPIIDFVNSRLKAPLFYTDLVSSNPEGKACDEIKGCA